MSKAIWLIDLLGRVADDPEVVRDSSTNGCALTVIDAAVVSRKTVVKIVVSAVLRPAPISQFLAGIAQGRFSDFLKEPRPSSLSPYPSTSLWACAQICAQQGTGWSCMERHADMSEVLESPHQYCSFCLPCESAQVIDFPCEANLGSGG